VTVAGGASSSREALDGAIDALRAAGVEDPRLDAEVLLAAATGLERSALIAGAKIEPAAARRFGEMVRRRLRREPVAYVVGRKGFRGIELAVDSQVLIPRPETELLVEVALERQPATVLDVGTGSGAIALAVASELPECEVTATDTSPSALGVARANAERLGLGERVRFLPGSLPEEEDFELILANLPYVAESEWGSLQPEVTRWEPRQALLAGPEGLDAIRELIASLAAHHGRYASTTVTAAALEIGAGQADAVEALMREAGFVALQRRRDLAGIERVVLGEL
jgi:release factor glutamine methyltransferase